MYVYLRAKFQVSILKLRKYHFEIIISFEKVEM